tara:strand:+ start:1565 stop:1738 length:174 start_codon:yes stop_codon:yes gene_type:complete
MKTYTPEEQVIIISIGLLFMFGLMLLACVTVYIDFINEDKKQRKNADRKKQSSNKKT